MNELDSLQAKFHQSVRWIDGALSACDSWAEVRAELLRMARDDADARIALECEHDWQVMRERAEKAEAELAALRKRCKYFDKYLDNIGDNGLQNEFNKWVLCDVKD